MSALLDDIISLAVDGKQPLPDILRKCLLLGHQLKNETLKDWANQELNGYPSTKLIPEYRIVQAEARGNFTGRFGSGARNWPIPSVALNKEHRDFGEVVYLTQAVSAYQDVANHEQDNITFPWPSNLALIYQTRFFQGRYVLVSAWQEISKSTIVELLDSIRNRTLNMALQLKDELGTSYADLSKVHVSEASKIQNIIFQNTGGNTTVAFGHATVDASTHTQNIVAAGDKQALESVLSNAGLERADLEKLDEVIQADGGKKIGAKVKSWIGEHAAKVLVGGGKIGVKIGQEVLTEWLMQYFGLK
jgi:AbiTii-like protein